MRALLLGQTLVEKRAGGDASDSTERLDPELPYLYAEVDLAVTEDSALRLDDVLARRLPLSCVARDQGLGCAEQVASRNGGALQWSPERTAAELAQYRTIVALSRFSSRDPSAGNSKRGFVSKCRGCARAPAGSRRVVRPVAMVWTNIRAGSRRRMSPWALVVVVYAQSSTTSVPYGGARSRGAMESTARSRRRCGCRWREGLMAPTLMTMPPRSSGGGCRIQECPSASPATHPPRVRQQPAQKCIRALRLPQKLIDAAR